MHNASFAFITSLTQHLPFMISGTYLDRILLCSSLSAAAVSDDDMISSRKQCLGFVAKLVDPKVLFQALERNWAVAANSGYSVSSISTKDHGESTSRLHLYRLLPNILKS